MTPLFLRLALIGGLALLPGPGHANEPEPAAQGGAHAPAAGATPTLTPATPLPATPVVPVVAGAGGGRAGGPQTETQQYCSNIAAQAADARFAWQRKQITDLQAQLKQRIGDLDAKEAEFKAVMQKRDDMMKKAVDEVVTIYTKMKPDAAAAQIAALDDDMAAAILTQLPPKQASLVLNEIPTEKAAKLVTTMTAIAAPALAAPAAEKKS